MSESLQPNLDLPMIFETNLVYDIGHIDGVDVFGAGPGGEEAENAGSAAEIEDGFSRQIQARDGRAITRRPGKVAQHLVMNAVVRIGGAVSRVLIGANRVEYVVGAGGRV